MPRDPIEGTIQNLFRLRELENSVADETSGLLVELFNEMAAEITRVDPVGADLEIQDQRVQELIDEIAALTGSTFDEVQSVIADRATEIGVQQAEEAGRQFRRTVGEEAFDQLGLALGGDVVSPSQMRSIVTSEPFRGATLSEWAENQSERTVFKVRRQIQLGLSQNETLDEMVRRVRGRQAGFLRFDPDTGDFVPKGTEGAVVRPRFQGGVLNTTTREAESIVRTAINHVASRGHEEVFSQDPQVSREYRYTAVLDSRTTIICASLDGQTFEYGEGPMPPQHFACRSIITPVVRWDNLPVDRPPRGTRQSMDGQVSSKTTYENWLRDQSKERQNEVLGPSRAKLFREKGVGLDEMVKNDGKRVTVDELRERADG